MATWTIQSRSSSGAFTYTDKSTGGGGSPLGLLLALTTAGAAWTNLIKSTTLVSTLPSKSTSVFTNTTRNVMYLWGATTFPWLLDYPWLQDNGAIFTFLTKN